MTSILKIAKRSGQYRNVYGVPTTQMAIYPPNELRELIQQELVVRTVRDGAGLWNESRVIIDLLYAAFGKTPPSAAQNGGSDD